MFKVLDDGVIQSNFTGELYFNIDRIIGENLKSQNASDFKKRLERYKKKYSEIKKINKINYTYDVKKERF